MIQELLPAVALGIATPEEIRLVKTALETDTALQAEYAQIQMALVGLGAGAGLEPPSDLKAKVLKNARASLPRTSHPRPRVRVVSRSPRLPLAFPWVMAGLLATLTAVVVFFAQPASQINATTLATTLDGSIIYANSGAMSRVIPVVFVRSDGSSLPIKFSTNKESQFKAAISSDGLTYLLDSANSTVFIIEEKTGTLIDRWLVPENATAMDVVGNTVVVRSNLVALIFRRNQSGEKSMVEARLSSSSKPNASPEAAVIDGNNLYTTDQVAGVIHVLSSQTGQEKTQFEAPEKPISLAVRNGLWVLDAAGELLKLELATGMVLERIPLEGTPQLLRLTDQYAFVADQEGFMSVIDLTKKAVTARKRLQNPAMGLSIMPDGHLAVALEKRGIIVLDDKLEMIKQIN